MEECGLSVQTASQEFELNNMLLTILIDFK